MFLDPTAKTVMPWSHVMRVNANMTRTVVTIDPDTTLDEAFDFMKDADIRHLPVVEGRNLVGILSERDILLRATYEEGEVNVPIIEVGEVMTTDVATCSPRSQISDVAVTMLEQKIDCLPVVSDDELVGLITSSDLLNILATRRESTGEETLPYTFNLRRYTGRESHPRPWV